MCNSTSIINSNTTIITIAISSCLTIIDWGVVSLFSSIRDENNRKKDIQTKYLVEAYRDIGIFNTRENHNAITMEVYEKYERAIRDIQIYGSLKEIELVNDYVMNVSVKGYNIDPLLNELRNNLRKSINLEKTDTPTHWVIYKDLFN